MLVPVTEMGPEGLEVDRAVRPAAGMEAGGHPLDLGSATVRGRVQEVGLGFEFRGRVETSIHLPCSRCLESYRLELSLPFELVYRRGQGSEAVPGADEETRDDPAIAYLDEGRIDLGKLVEEQVYLSLPLKPLCRSDCRGLCPRCGAAWNREECDCEAESVDPRWDALRELKRT